MGASLHVDGAGETFYVHCDVTKEEAVKVTLYL